MLSQCCSASAASPVCHDALANVGNDLRGLLHCELNLVQVVNNLVQLLRLFMKRGGSLQAR